MVGPDDIPVEIRRCLGERVVDLLTRCWIVPKSLGK